MKRATGGMLVTVSKTLTLVPRWTPGMTLAEESVKTTPASVNSCIGGGSFRSSNWTLARRLFAEIVTAEVGLMRVKKNRNLTEAERNPRGNREGAECLIRGKQAGPVYGTGCGLGTKESSVAGSVRVE